MSTRIVTETIEYTTTTATDDTFQPSRENGNQDFAVKMNGNHEKSDRLVSSDLSEGVSLAWKDLTYTITNSKTKEKQNILEGACGILKPGEVMAIMGPSGAGKSTLLDVLAGRKDPKAVSGHMYLNGKGGEIKYVSTYVEQEDALMGVLTVRENIQFAADLCFPSTFTKSDRITRVQAIIEEFGLERVADNKIGTVFVRGVSGGEKRRAAIASQIITLPKVIFLDEPTTGLDSAAAYNVMKTIVGMARKHKLTVIASIHQPSTETYSLFDKLCLIGRGHTLYMGDREDAVSYFEKLGHICPPFSNPADYFLQLINSDFLTEKEKADDVITSFIDGFQKSETNSKLLADISTLIENSKDDDVSLVCSNTRNRYARNFFAQTGILMVRSFTNAIRNVLMFWVRVAMYVCLALLMGSTWWQVGFKQESINDRFSAHFFSVAFLAFMSVAGIPGFLEERLVFQRERANGFYSVGPYVVANTLISFPFVAIIAFSFTIVAYPMIGLNSGFSNAVLFCVYLFLALIVAESMVVFVAAIIPIFVAALTIVAFLNGFWMVVEGYFVHRDAIPKGWKWAHYIDYQKYAFEAIIKNDFDGLTFTCSQSANPAGVQIESCNGNKDGTFDGSAVLDYYGYTEIQFWSWAVALIGLMLAFRVGFYIALRVRKAHK